MQLSARHSLSQKSWYTWTASPLESGTGAGREARPAARSSARLTASALNFSNGGSSSPRVQVRTGCGGRGPRNSAVRSLLPSSIPTNAADAAWNLPTAPARKRWTLIQHRRFSRLLGIGFYWLARAKPGRETRCTHGDRSMWATAARTGLRCASLAARSRAPRRHLRRGSFLGPC